MLFVFLSGYFSFADRRGSNGNTILPG